MANQQTSDQQRATELSIPEPQAMLSSMNSTENERLRNDLTFYQREYEKFLNRPTYEHVKRQILS